MEHYKKNFERHRSKRISRLSQDNGHSSSYLPTYSNTNTSVNVLTDPQQNIISSNKRNSELSNITPEKLNQNKRDN